MRPPTRIPAPALRRPGSCICCLILALALLPAGAVAQTAEPADAPAAMLALRYDPAIDPAGWWVSEKLDGVRDHGDCRLVT